MEWNGKQQNTEQEEKVWNSCMEQNYGTIRKRLKWNGMEINKIRNKNENGLNRGENTEQSLNTTLVF